MLGVFIWGVLDGLGLLKEDIKFLEHSHVVPLFLLVADLVDFSVHEEPLEHLFGCHPVLGCHHLFIVLA